MKLYGLTGGPGMGKSAAASWLADQGVPIIDTDALAREVVQPHSPGFNSVIEQFGPEVITTDGSVDRAALARKTFSNPESRRRLESILHPLIRERWIKQAEDWRKDGVAAGVVVIPLLFETAAEQYFESVVCIACSPTLQSARLQERGWDAEQVTGRLAAQWPIAKKMDQSHFVIWNDATLEVLREQLGRVPPLKGSQKTAAKKTID